MKNPLIQTILTAATGLAALLASVALAVGASPKEVAVPVAYSAPVDGFLSLALYNDRGQLVRSLLSAKSVKAGSGSIAWDGTSDLGIPQPTGTYSTKAIFFKEKPKAEFVMTVGKSGSPPYRTPDGKGDWGANLGGPAAICSNSDSVMMVWGCVEDNQITGIQQMDGEKRLAGSCLKIQHFQFSQAVSRRVSPPSASSRRKSAAMGQPEKVFYRRRQGGRSVNPKRGEALPEERQPAGFITAHRSMP